jgi:uncharacterized membrane protein
LCINLPVTLPLGSLAYLVVPKPYRFLRHHLMQVVVWQLLFLPILVVVILLAHYLAHATDPLARIIDALVYKTDLERRFIVHYTWLHAVSKERLLIVSVAALLLLNLAVSLWSAVYAILGRPFRLPVLGKPLASAL